MVDIIDTANLHSEQLLQLEIESQLNKPVDKVEHSGECNNCYEEVELPKLFCDGNCAAMYHRRKSLPLWRG